ncbi:MAG: hypothetical protein ACRCY4_03000 [Brevinema sp.]
MRFLLIISLFFASCSISTLSQDDFLTLEEGTNQQPTPNPDNSTGSNPSPEVPEVPTNPSDPTPQPEQIFAPKYKVRYIGENFDQRILNDEDYVANEIWFSHRDIVPSVSYRFIATKEVTGFNDYGRVFAGDKGFSSPESGWQKGETPYYNLSSSITVSYSSTKGATLPIAIALGNPNAPSFFPFPNSMLGTILGVPYVDIEFPAGLKPDDVALFTMYFGSHLDNGRNGVPVKARFDGIE